ncbi:polysaccharide deacetylase family protein [Devosia riboflavina]
MRSDSTELTIINFHGIDEPARDLEPGEAPFWLSRAQFCAALDRVAIHPNRRQIGITFDDSNKSDLTIAVPELLKRGLTARFFILTGRFGAEGSLDESDVRELFGAGMDIGSHGVAHRDFTRLAPDELREELSQSKMALEQLRHGTINAFSVPFGRYNAKVLTAIRTAGYRAIYTSDGGRSNPDHFLRPRRSLRNDMSMRDVDRVLTDRLSLVRRLRRTASAAVKQLT